MKKPQLALHSPSLLNPLFQPFPLSKPTGLIYEPKTSLLPSSSLTKLHKKSTHGDISHSNIDKIIPNTGIKRNWSQRNLPLGDLIIGKSSRLGNHNLMQIGALRKKLGQSNTIQQQHQQCFEKNQQHHLVASSYMSKGKLHTSKQTKPTILLSRQERLNPYCLKKPEVNEKLIQKKGILELLSMGVLEKEMDFGQLLNSKYEVIRNQKLNEDVKRYGNGKRKQEIDEMLDTFFPTNPLTNQGLSNPKEEAINENQSESLKQTPLAQGTVLSQSKTYINLGQQPNQTGGGTRKSKSRNKIKPPSKIIPPELPPQKTVLTVLNYYIDKTQESYKSYYRKILAEGMEVQFRIFIEKMEEFVRRYKVKKAHLDPEKHELYSLRKITDWSLVKCIENHRILGLDRLVRGSKEEQDKARFKMVADRIRYQKSKGHLKKLEQLKRYFRIRKFYTKMIIKREQFVKLKLESFAQSQRRYMEQHQQSHQEGDNSSLGSTKRVAKGKYSTQVEIHILSLNFSPSDQKTHYKLRQRCRTQLTRLFNTMPEEIILLIDQDDEQSEQYLKFMQQSQNPGSPSPQLLTSSLSGVRVSQPTSSINWAEKEKTLKNIPQVTKFAASNSRENDKENQEQNANRNKLFYEDYLENLQGIHTKIHVIKLGSTQEKKFNKQTSNTAYYNKVGVEKTASIYYGLNSEVIHRIKSICLKRKVTIVPYLSSINLVKIAEFLGVNFYGGNLSKQSIHKISQNGERAVQYQSQIVHTEQISKPLSSRLQKLSGAISGIPRPSFSRSLLGIYLSNYFFQNKTNVKHLFSKTATPTPFYLEANISQNIRSEQDFLARLAIQILTRKEVNRWVFKLPMARFSRGLAFLETDTLKILKKKKKQLHINQEDFKQIAGILKSILIDKLEIPHNSLVDRKDFLTDFFAGFKAGVNGDCPSGYVEEMIEDTVGYIGLPNITPIAIFGRIQPSGVFTFLGSYRRIYTNEMVRCAGLYPAQQINYSSISDSLLQSSFQDILNSVSKLASTLYSQNTFGYITFELMFNFKTKEFYFIDLLPNLDQYSSFYFFYKEKFGINENQTFIEGKANARQNMLPKSILYCPFVDNNGNKIDTIQEFQRQLWNRKAISATYRFNVQQEHRHSTEMMSYRSINSRQDKQAQRSQKNILKHTFNGNNSLQSQKFIGRQPSNTKSRKNTQEGYQIFYLTPNRPDVFSIACFANQQKTTVKMLLQVLTFIIDVGNKFNKFDKKYGARFQFEANNSTFKSKSKLRSFSTEFKSGVQSHTLSQNQQNFNKDYQNQSPRGISNKKLDGLYVMDILSKFRELKKNQKLQKSNEKNKNTINLNQ